jgi:hypothetical protein
MVNFNTEDTMKKTTTIVITLFVIMSCGPAATKQNPFDFVPKGYKVFETIHGDVNKDGIEDLVLIIKETNKKKIVRVEDRGKLDRNRRGIIVLLKNNGQYELTLKNLICFSSEHEDGGVYYAPELSIEIIKGNLCVTYEHGRYGNWIYTFRYQSSNFELIGFDASENRGPVIERETSINFLTKMKQERIKTNDNADSGEEVFNTTSEKIKVDKLLRLSDIKDFDELDLLSRY